MSGLRGLYRAFFSIVFLITLLAGKNFAQIADSTKISISSQTSDTLAVDSLDKRRPVKGQKKFLDGIVKYSAKDSCIMWASKKKIYLFGEASIDYTTINLKAYYVEIDMDKKTISARGKYDSLEGMWIGKPVFTDKDKSFTSEEMSYNFETKKGLVKSVVTQEGEGFLHGERVKYTKERLGKDTLEVIYVKGGRYTTCNLEEPHFHIRASKIKVIKEKKIITGPANFVVENVPTPIFLPFGYFPTQKEKASGIIFPQYGVQAPFGFFLKDLGFYWAASPKIDLAAFGSIYTNGSFGVGLKSQYKIRYKVEGNISIRYNRVVRGSDPKLPDYQVDPNWNFQWTHQQDSKWLPGFTFKADVNIVTSGFNKFNQLDINQFVQNTFRSSVLASYAIPKTPFNVMANITYDQNTMTGVTNITLPEFVWTTSRFFPFKNRKRPTPATWWQNIWEGIGITHNTSFGNRIITSDTTFSNDLRTLFKGKITNGMRHTFSANNSFKLFKYINFTPSFNYIEYWNFRHLEKYYDNTAQQLVSDTLQGFFTDREWDARADFTTNLFGFFTFKKGKVKAIRQVFTPTVYFSYNPNFDRSVYGYYGANNTFGSYRPNDISFYPGPTRGPAGMIGFNLSNNVEMKVASKKDTITGEKKIKLIDAFVINGAYNLFADSLNLQPFGIQFRTSFFENKLSVVFNAQLDPYAIDTAGQGRRINKFEIKETGKLARFSSASLAVTYALIGKPREQLNVNNNLTTPEERRMVMLNQSQYLDFNVPYNLSFTYNFTYMKPLKSVVMTNVLQVAGDISITKNWKIDFRTGFDFVSKKPVISSIGINRDLHCWQMSFQWIPFGQIASYVFTIQAKSSLLQDLKLNRRNTWAPTL